LHAQVFGPKQDATAVQARLSQELLDNPEVLTLNPKPLDPGSHIMHPDPRTLNPTPETLNP